PTIRAETGHVGAGQRAAEGADRPRVPRRGPHPLGVQAVALRPPRPAGEDRVGDLPQHPGLVLDDRRPIGREAVGPETPASGPTLPGPLELRPGDALAGALGLLAGHGAEAARHHPTRRGGQVDVTGPHGGDLGARLLDGIDERLEVAGVPVGPVGVPGDDGAQPLGPQVVEETLVLGAAAAVEGADVVVDVLGDVGPAAGGGELTAVGELPRGTLAISAVEADPGVDADPSHARSLALRDAKCARSS